MRSNERAKAGFEMGYWSDFGFWDERREDLLREAEERRLAREGREGARRGRMSGNLAVMEEPGIEVRWGLPEDEAAVADLLQMNGMPRWVAFEERFIVAEEDGKVLAALRYRTESKRLLLGLLVVDPWAGEGRMARALYSGARDLALELGAREVLARTVPFGDYPREAGYRRWGRGWRLDATRSVDALSEPTGWCRVGALLGRFAVPFFRVWP